MRGRRRALPAAAYQVPLSVLVLRNDEYAILKWFGMLENIQDAPGLDLPRLDCVAVAAGYGMAAERAGGVDELREKLARDLGSGTPTLLEVPVAPGMALV